MPRIPRAKEPGVRPRTGVPAVPVLNEVDKTIANAADNLTKFAQAHGEAQLKAATQTYASNAYSQDLIETNKFITQLDLNAAPDGAGYTQSVQNFLQERQALRKEHSPSDEAFSLYSQRFSELQNRVLIRAQGRENKLRTDYAVNSRNDLVEEFSGRMLIAPNGDDLVEFLRGQEHDVMAETGVYYSHQGALNQIEKTRSRAARSFLDGLEAGEQPERILSIFRQSVPAEEFDEAMATAGFDRDATLAMREDPALVDEISKSLTPGEKSRRFKSAIQAVKAKNKRNTGADTEELKNLGIILSQTGTDERINPEKERLFERLRRNTSIAPSDKMAIMDTVLLSEASGNASKRVLKLPFAERHRAGEIFEEEVANQKESLMKELQKVSDLGYSSIQMEEAAGRATSFQFNAQARIAAKSAFDKSIQKGNKMLVEEPATYFQQQNGRLSTLATMAMKVDGVSDAQRSAQFEGYAKELDANFQHFGISESQRKYLTPDMSTAYSNYIRSAQAIDEKVQRVIDIQQMAGPKAKSIFNEMAKRKDLDDSIYAISLMRPSARREMELLYEKVMNKEDIIDKSKRIDGRSTVVQDLKKKISESTDNLNRALGEADPSGGNQHIVNGLSELLNLAVMNDMNNGMEMEESFRRWEPAIIGKHKPIMSGQSSAIVTHGQDHLIPDVDDFMANFEGAGPLYLDTDSLSSQLNLDLGPSPYLKNFADSHGLDVDRVYSERLENAKWITGSNATSLVLARPDGTPITDRKGKIIEVDYERMPSLKRPIPKTPNIYEFPGPPDAKDIDSGPSFIDDVMSFIFPNAEAGESTPRVSFGKEQAHLRGDHLVQAVSLGNEGVGNISGYDVDTTALGRWEANSLWGYVPQNSTEAGFTIAMGVDFGSRSVAEVKSWKLDPFEEAEILQYKELFGKKGDEARDALAAYVQKNGRRPILSSTDFAKKLSRIAVQEKVKGMAKITKGDSKKGFKTSDRKYGDIKFDKLSRKAQTVLVSLAYNYGNSGAHGLKAVAEMKKGNWVKAAEYLRRLTNNRSRRIQEAEMLESSVEYINNLRGE